MQVFTVHYVFLLSGPAQQKSTNHCGPIVCMSVKQLIDAVDTNVNQSNMNNTLGDHCFTPTQIRAFRNKVFLAIKSELST
jgi:hypothetical protein